MLIIGELVFLSTNRIPFLRPSFLRSWHLLPRPARILYFYLGHTLIHLFFRVNMCTLAAEETNTWLTVDTWEAFQSYQRSAVVLDHFDYEINHRLGGVYTEDGEHRNVRIMLLAGSDLIATMSAPGVWSYADVRS